MTRFRDWIYVSLRVPKPLHQYLSHWAKQEQRSLHGHIVWLLTQAIQAHQQPARAELMAIINDELNDGPPNSIIHPR